MDFTTRELIETLREAGNWSAVFARLAQHSGDVRLRHALYALLLHGRA